MTSERNTFDLHRRAHAVGVARVQPERLLDQLAHRRQNFISGEIEPVREPAFLGQEPDEVAGKRRIRAGLEDHSAKQGTIDDERPPE